MTIFKKDIPYNNLPLLPPKRSLETVAILRKTIVASRELSKLNGAIINLPNPRLFLDTIHLQEAKGSSEIENIITTNDDLYQAFVADKKFDNVAAKEVISYKEALWHALAHLEKKPFLTTNLFIEIVQRIKQNDSGIRTTPGTTLSNAKGEVIYTPPSGEDIIRDKLSNLEKFINTPSKLDPLIKMALMHYQFEAIHPFSDGNGRTGRILLLLYLKLEKLLDVPAIYLSEHIINNKAAYYKKLRLVTEKEDWEGWILFMLEMVEITAKKGLERLEAITSLMERMTNEIRTQLPKAYSRELIEILFRLPYTKRQYLIDEKLGTPKTVGNYLRDLEEAGFLKSVKVGKEKLYLNFQLMEILEK
ncbi:MULTISPECIES: Fic family protein [Flavobacteriaceae]|uniref:Fic family protein n=1 Tax=Flavobacteriaceae TaxID=49546 RepID=UPI00149090A0|nr:MULTISPECIES: Fic/DOC family N-terminal domain-containing protein [Allomuricauda]MDC6367693.1 Fic/DOC family N-terminal domain-containing protein [Muricauda sp. AC10]